MQRQESRVKKPKKQKLTTQELQGLLATALSQNQALTKAGAGKQEEEPEEEKKPAIDPDQVDAAFDTGPTEEERAQKAAEDALEAKKKKLFAELGRLFGGKPAKLLYAFNIAVESKLALKRLDENGNPMNAAKPKAEEDDNMKKKRSASSGAKCDADHDFHPEGRVYKRLKNPNQ